MKIVYVLMACGLLLSCREKPLGGDADEVVARVGDHVLLRKELVVLIPKNLSRIDSLIAAGSIMKRWAKDILVYETALKNVGTDELEILRMVEDYRRSLICHRYQERLVQEKLNMKVSEGEKVAFYEEKCKEFPLSGAIIRGLLLKVPLNAPGLYEIKNIYKKESEQALESIEKYSMQNAILYEYFYDHWKSFEDVMRNIPTQVKNADAFLATNHSLEVNDDSYCYLLHVSEYLPSGDIAPYDYVSDQITIMLIHQRKTDFLNDFENDLYEMAVSRGKVYIYE
jgi:hypothetical protein